ncbi:MAG: 50S ribosomal protein L31e [Candidatus Pacearchaeota archaeon]|nr:50S ribosomal protein L31e [Nanoarchaeota archaeon]MDZ4226723.1 50S ribosomal protein L31e [Candidatus Pacearchaeota archaeon]
MAEETSKPETKKEGKEFIIPLRRKFRKTVSYNRAPKAIKVIREFLVRHMKVYDRDLRKIKLDKYLNEFVWNRGIKNPPAKIKVRAFIDGDFIRVELVELTEKLKFKKGKLEKRERKTEKAAPKKEELAEVTEKTVEEKAEEKEKKAAVVEAGQKMEKIAEKQAKHQTKISKQPKRQRRMALQK